MEIERKKFYSKNKRTDLADCKKSIFNLILHSKKIDCSLDNSNILDLFSGTGSFGLECISRNKYGDFFENYNETLNILKKNIKILNVENNVKLLKKLF